MTRQKLIILLFSAALISGFFWNQKMFGQPIGSDQLFYDGVAQNLVGGRGFTSEGKESAGEPLYPLFLAGIYGIFGRVHDTVRIAQIFLFALTVVFVFLTAEIFFGWRLALWPALATALFYGLANQSGGILTEPLFIFLISLFVWFLCKEYQEDKYRWLILSGAALGLAALTRGIVQFLFIPIIANLFFIYRKSFKKALTKSALFLIVFSAVLLPWLVRDSFINNAGGGAIVAPRGGVILAARAELMDRLYDQYPAHFIGHLLGYYFTQKIYPDVSSAAFRETPLTDKRITILTEEGKDSEEIDQILTGEAKNEILKNPHKYILMSLLDFISFNSPIIFQGSLWGNTLTIHPMFAEVRHPEIPDWQKAGIILGIRGIWFLLLFLVIYAIAKNIKKWRKFGWIFLIIFYFNLAYSAVHAIPRYALPIYPFYVILAVAGVLYFYNKYVKKQA